MSSVSHVSGRVSSSKECWKVCANGWRRASRRERVGERWRRQEEVQLQRRGDEMDDVQADPTASSSTASTLSEDALAAKSAREPDRESLRRALRELEATNVRVQRNAERVYQEERSKLVMNLLPVLDNVDRTLLAAASKSDASLVKGLHMVRAQLEGVLVGYGVERVDANGMRFDPVAHEAVAMVPVADPQLHGMVMQQSEAGYRFGGRLLRAAKVSVGAFTPDRSFGGVRRHG